MEKSKFIVAVFSLGCLVSLIGCASSRPQNGMESERPLGHNIHLAISANASDAKLLTMDGEAVADVPLGEEIYLDGYNVSAPYGKIIKRVLDGTLLKGFKYNYYLEAKVAAPNHKTREIKEYIGQYREREYPPYQVKEAVILNVDLEPVEGYTAPETAEQEKPATVEESSGTEPETAAEQQEAAESEEPAAMEPEQPAVAEPELKATLEPEQPPASEPEKEYTSQRLECAKDCRKMQLEGQLRRGLTIEQCINMLCL